MEDIISIVVIAALVAVGIFSARKHFKGKSGCCGGGSTYISKKKLDKVIAKKTVIVDGMTCENCVARVTRAINDLDGAAAKVNLKKKEVRISLAKEISDDQLRAVIEKAGYTVVAFR